MLEWRTIFPIVMACCLGRTICRDSSSAMTGMLYPRESETREQKSLDGIWNFRRTLPTEPFQGYKEYWQLYDLKHTGDVIPMPVPSSYNDITEDILLRDHVGPVWYDRTFFVPTSWNNNNTRVWLRFGSVHYSAQVWVNGQLAMNHEIGHLPFQQDVTNLLHFGDSNRVTVACDNSLSKNTIPQGFVSETETENGKVKILSYSFDFFNYAGIHRPVTLHTTPKIYIEDVTVTTDLIENGKIAVVNFDIKISGYENDDYQPFCNVVLLDDFQSIVGEVKYDLNCTCPGQILVNNPKLWWPYLMSSEPGYMYTLQIKLIQNETEIINEVDSPLILDIYRLPIGIRTLKWTNTSFLINDKPVYLRGFGRHEDSDIRGKGLDLALITKDYNLIQWIGANAYRTSHYPYADEVMDFADKLGIMIIDECPSVDTENYSDELLQNHKTSLSELIRRDKNRPGVIAWSIANEPRTQLVAADDYFGAVAVHTRSLDPTRPLTAAIARSYSEDRLAKHLDIISFNRYNGWYSNPGRLDMITNQVIAEATGWNKKHNKPIIMSEYGSDTMAGLHLYPAYVWSEEYQVQMMSKHFQAFDFLRKQGFFIGEFIWNFADFKTAQTYTRVGGNNKGIFTRARQPKTSAFHLRKRYFGLAKQLDNVTLPNDLSLYSISN